MAENFGKQITIDEASAYFKRYVNIRNKNCKMLKGLRRLDDEAKRFYTGRLGASDPVAEDLMFVFDPESVKRLLADMEKKKCDSLVIFMGTRNETNPDLGESNGRPTLIVFPAKKGEVKRAIGYTLSNLAEEHPGSGGTGGSGGSGIRMRRTSTGVTTKIPEFIPEDSIYPFI
jgi:hypothetical protein